MTALSFLNLTTTWYQPTDTSESLSFLGNSKPGVGSGDPEFVKQQNPKKILENHQHTSMYFSGLLCIGNPMRDSSLSYFHCSFSEKVIGENQTADLKQESRREVKTYAIQTKETLSASGMPGAYRQ